MRVDVFMQAGGEVEVGFREFDGTVSFACLDIKWRGKGVSLMGEITLYLPDMKAARKLASALYQASNHVWQGVDVEIIPEEEQDA